VVTVDRGPVRFASVWRTRVYDPTDRYPDHPHSGGLDPAHRLSSVTGEQLLDDATEAQATWVRETVATDREKRGGSTWPR
jgi:hypothetical protein